MSRHGKREDRDPRNQLIYYAIDIIQNKKNIMSFEDYDPPSSLVVEGEEIKKAKYPFVDVHSHQWGMPTMDLNKLASEMDEINMGFLINLSGSGFGPQVAKDVYFDESIENINENQPKRIGLFLNVDFSSVDDEDYAEKQVAIIRDAVSKGAIGLKVYKSLGLKDKDSKGERVRVDEQMKEKRHSAGSCRSTRMPGTTSATAAIRWSAAAQWLYSGRSGSSSWK